VRKTHINFQLLLLPEAVVINVSVLQEKREKIESQYTIPSPAEQIVRRRGFVFTESICIFFIDTTMCLSDSFILKCPPKAHVLKP
jgi:hypothetical protein